MKNRMIFEFDSIDLHESRSFYNKIRNEVIEIFKKESFIKNLKTQLDCNIR